MVGHKTVVLLSATVIALVVVTLPVLRTRYEYEIDIFFATKLVVGVVLVNSKLGNFVTEVVAGAEFVGLVCNVSNVALLENVPPLSISACETL